jgi:ATP synthase protein I
MMSSVKTHRPEKARDLAAPTAAKTRGYARTITASSIGLEMALAVVIGTLFGYWADGKLDTRPWLMILGIGFGFAAGMKGVFRYVRQAERDAKDGES